MFTDRLARMKFFAEFGWADARSRRTASLLNALAVFVPVAFVLVVWHFASYLHAEQARALDAGSETICDLSPADLSNPALALDADKLTALAARKDVRAAFPKIELHVRLAADPGGKIEGTAESTIPDDPRTTGPALARGLGVTGPDADEVVLSAAAATALGRGDRLRVEVSRTFDGKPETFAASVKVAGVVARPGGPVAFLPAGLLRKLDLWCEGKIEGPPTGPSGATGVTYPGLVLYGPPAAAARLEAELSPLGLSAGKGEAVRVPASDAPVWVTFARGAEPASAREAAKAAPGARVWTAAVWSGTVGGRAVTVAALPADDPRWATAGGPPPAGKVVAVTADDPPAEWAVIGRAADLPTAAGFVTTPVTLAELAYDPAAPPGAVTLTRIAVPDAATAAKLDDLIPGVVIADPGAGLRVYDAGTVDAARDAARRIAKLFPHCRVALTPVGALPAERGTARVRFLPDAAFAALADPAATELPAIRVARGATPAPAPGAINGRPLTRVADLAGTADEVWVPATTRHLLGAAAAEPTGFAVWGDALRVPDLGRGADLGVPVAEVAASAVPVFHALYRGTPEQVRALAGDAAPADRLTVVRAVEATVVIGRRRAEVFCVPAADGAGHVSLVWAGAYKGPADVVGGGGVVVGPLPVRAAAGLDPRLAGVDAATFRRLLPPGRAAPETRPEVVVEVPALLFPRVRAAATADGLTVRPLKPAADEPLARYPVKAKDGAGVRGEVLGPLGLNRATVTAVVPDLKLTATAGGVATEWAVTTPIDPARFLAGLRAGAWVGDAAGPADVVLPAALAAALFPGAPVATLPGRPAELVFTADPGTAAADARVPVRVVGVADGKVGYVPVALADQVRRWRAGKLVYQPAEGRFATPVEVADRSGAYRATVVARSADAVRPLADELTARGYRCRDNLADRDAVRRLGRVAAGTTAAFAAAFLLLAGLTVYITTSLNIAGKRWQIGLLQAHGLSRAEVAAVYAAQGGVLAAVGAVAGCGGAVGLERLGAWVLRTAFRLPPSALSDGLADGPVWVFAVAVAVSVGVATAAAAIPAARAGRFTPVENMRTPA